MNDNIIAVNVPNAVSIVIMAAIGGVLLHAARKALDRRRAAMAAAETAA